MSISGKSAFYFGSSEETPITPRRSLRLAMKSTPIHPSATPPSSLAPNPMSTLDAASRSTTTFHQQKNHDSTLPPRHFSYFNSLYQASLKDRRPMQKTETRTIPFDYTSK